MTDEQEAERMRVKRRKTTGGRGFEDDLAKVMSDLTLANYTTTNKEETGGMRARHRHRFCTTPPTALLPFVVPPARSVVQTRGQPRISLDLRGTAFEYRNCLYRLADTYDEAVPEAAVPSS